MITLSTCIACIAMALFAGIGVGAAVFAIINDMMEGEE